VTAKLPYDPPAAVRSFILSAPAAPAS
jgi:hypothetical protein